MLGTERKGGGTEMRAVALLIWIWIVGGCEMDDTPSKIEARNKRK
jgi:hypothetical protein